jgi:acyl carrier protein
MSSQQVPPSLRDLLADILEVSPDEITAESGTETVESWDSFRHLQAILAIEGEYGVQFDPQRIPELTTVGKIQAELAAKGATL